MSKYSKEGNADKQFGLKSYLCSILGGLNRGRELANLFLSQTVVRRR